MKKGHNICSKKALTSISGCFLYIIKKEIQKYYTLKFNKNAKKNAEICKKHLQIYRYGYILIS